MHRWKCFLPHSDVHRHGFVHTNTYWRSRISFSKRSQLSLLLVLVYAGTTLVTRFREHKRLSKLRAWLVLQHHIYTTTYLSSGRDGQFVPHASSLRHELDRRRENRISGRNVDMDVLWNAYDNKRDDCNSIFPSDQVIWPRLIWTTNGCQWSE